MKIETSNYKQLAFEEKTAYKNAIQRSRMNHTLTSYKSITCWDR